MSTRMPLWFLAARCGAHGKLVSHFYDLIPASFKFSGGAGDEAEKMQDRVPAEKFMWRGQAWRPAA